MELRVRVGAATDASFNAVFRALPAAAADANKKVTADAKSNAKAQDDIRKQQLDLTKKNFAELIRETGKVHDQTRKIEMASHEARLKLREEAAKKATAIELAEATIRAKGAAAIELMQAKEAARQVRAATGGGASGGGGRGSGRDMAYRMGYWASRNLSPVTPMLSFASRMGNDVLRGTGVDFNVGGMVAQQMELQKRTTALSNQGYQNGQPGAADKRVNPAALEADIRGVGKEFGFAYDEVSAAMTKFVDISGNLDQARAVMGGLARLSNATGTELHDMAAAGAAVAVQLDRAMGDDTQGKATALQSIMRTFAGQGKLGAVEMKDLAVQMAKIAVVAPRFAGNIEDVFADVGVLAQESRKAGGSASASQAATSIARFADLMVNPKTQKAFTKQMTAEGMAPETLFADKEQTKLRPVEELILTSLAATKGSLPKMQGLFKNVMANRAIEGFAGVYNKTQGTQQEKLQAVHQEYQSLKNAALTEAREREDNARVMETAAKKAQVFQDKLQDVVGEMADKVIPAFEKLAPVALEVMTGFTHMMGFLAENPLAILPVALAAAVAKAGVEQALRVGIENVFRNFTGGAGGGSGAGGVKGAIGGVAGNLASAFVIASAAVTITEVGALYIDKVMDDESKKQKKRIEGDIGAMNAESEYDVAAREYQKQLDSGAPTKESKEKFDAAKANLEAKARGLNTTEEKPGLFKKVLEEWMLAGPADQVAAVHADQERRHKEMMATMEEQNRLLLKLSGGVRVLNTTPFGPPPPPGMGGGTTNTGAAHP